MYDKLKAKVFETSDSVHVKLEAVMKAWSPSDALEAGFEEYMKEEEENGALDDEEDEETAGEEERADTAGVFEPLPEIHVERTLQPCVRSHAAQEHPVARCRSTCR